MRRRGAICRESKPAYQLDSGCTGRAYADVSADADPDTGLEIYDDGMWAQYGSAPSLASPLIAAYEAITGVGGTPPVVGTPPVETPEWAYDDSSLLNDPMTGSSGADCAPTILYICDAGPGYDGPTGIGSISGAVATGGPGIGGPSFGAGVGDTYTQSVGTSAAALSAGLYPNGLDTTYYWQYGPTTAYGLQTSSVDAGPGQAPVAATAQLAGLIPGVTYHYRLVAQNADGTTYGYDSPLTTGIAPVNNAPPSIVGSVAQGQSLYASGGSWTPAGNSFYYLWQRSPDGVDWTAISGATGFIYTLGAADAGDEVRVVVTAANLFGQASAASAAVGPVPSAAGGSNGSSSGTVTAPPRWQFLPRLSADPGHVGDVLTVTRGTWTGGPLLGDDTQVVRCTYSCVAAGPPNARRYTITPADVGSTLWVQETATNATGGAAAWSARSVGPVKSVSSAAVILSAGQTALRNSRGATLAIARIGSVSASADAGRARLGSRALVLSRARGVRGSVTGWVCSVAGVLGGPPPKCTARIALGAHASVRLPGSMRGRVLIVVVRQGR